MDLPSLSQARDCGTSPDIDILDEMLAS